VRSAAEVLRAQVCDIGRVVWHHLPRSVAERPPLRAMGRFAYRHVTRHVQRWQSHSTWFMRNPPLLEALRALVVDAPPESRVRVMSVACSTGAELYSVLFALRSARADLELHGLGFDICPDVVAAARRGVYSKTRPSSVRGQFATGWAELDPGLVAPDILGELFIEDGDSFRVRDELRRDTRWVVADAADPGLTERFEAQDIVLANNFLGPMEDREAELCLRNVARLVRPGGVLVLDGVDLDLKTRVLGSLAAAPVLDRLQAVYEADPTKGDWPWVRWAHEPLDRSRHDWALRYGTVFVLGRSARQADDCPGGGESDRLAASPSPTASERASSPL
jgi:chemotaxis methyl-accepting protein methylase